MHHTSRSPRLASEGLKHGLGLDSRRKLKPADARRFAHLEPGLFADIAAVVCSAGILPQKELHECWQMALCVHEEFFEYTRVADLAAGHGLLAWILVLLARHGEHKTVRTAVAVDVKRPKSAQILAAAVVKRWPEFEDAVHYVEGSIDAVHAQDGEDTLLVAIHACGSLSDRVLLAALNSRSAVAIMPCCHSLRNQTESLSMLAFASDLPTKNVENLTVKVSEAGQPAVIDQFRIDALTAVGYEIRSATISPDITLFNRIILGKPPLARRQYPQKIQMALPDCWSRRRGEIHAHEITPSINVASLTEARVLSKRPSREWQRSFDLSFWVESLNAEKNLRMVLENLVGRFLQRRAGIFHSADSVAPTTNVVTLDQYIDPLTKRLAFTYRIEIRSSVTEITRDHATMLRTRLCRALKYIGKHIDVAIR